MSWLAKDDQKKGFGFDKALEIFDRRFFFECETGSHYYKREKVIPKKVEHYLKLQGHFFVIFSIQDHEEVEARVYGEAIRQILGEYKRGTKFLVAPHQGLVKDVLGKWLIHPLGTTHSLDTVV